MHARKWFIRPILAGCLAPSAATATNGYFRHGYGLKVKWHGRGRGWNI